MVKHIVGLTGEMASGKSTVAKYLINTHKASLHRFSIPLRDVLKRLHLDESRTNLGKLSTNLRETFGQDLFARIIFNEVKEDNKEVVVVDGVRRVEDIHYLRELPEFKLVYIKVPIEARYKRISHRTENSDDRGKTFEQFKKEQAQEAETEIQGLEERADIVIKNDGTLEDLYAKIDAIVEM